MTALPDAVRQGVRAALGSEVTRVSPVSGGCINHGARIETAERVAYFLKWNARSPAGMFEAEADGLRALADAVGGGPGETPLRVPEPIALGHGPSAAEPHTRHGAERSPGTQGSSSVGWLVLEWIAPGPASPATDMALGHALAMIHDAPAPAGYGWHADNWIGRLPQSNRPTPSWSAFWRDERIGPQLARARDAGHVGLHAVERLLDRMDEVVSDDPAPSLLHGDLWGGNAYAAGDGAPVVIDPAVYRGHGEVDLAMTELFGGFGTAFYEAYRDARPLSSAYASHRRDLYQLYYLLVHVNLFGGAYVAGSQRAAERVLAALG